MNSYSISESRSSLIVLTIFLSAMIAACTAPNRPMAQIGSAEGSVSRTHAPIVQNNAPREAFSANMELTEAERALNEGHYSNVIQHTERAQLDAQLAETKAKRSVAEQRLAEVNADVEHLRNVEAASAR